MQQAERELQEDPGSGQQGGNSAAMPTPTAGASGEWSSAKRLSALRGARGRDRGGDAHAVAEEMYVYPAIEEHVPNGAKEVRHDRRSTTGSSRW